ncbi:MAG TPA: formate/nitrite transporter family protein [Symbiobacteriaceae bacterium]|nr:formate/nitrite transporter family protein [Symbiobacteriaceae bacterium]
MYREALEAVSSAAISKARFCQSRLAAFLLHSAMAGAYVGLGILLIFLVGAPLYAAKSPVTSLVMGATFGIALSLVLMAGSDLFTSSTMVMPVGAFTRYVSWGQVLRVLAVTYVGNFLGSLLVAWLAQQSGLFAAAPALTFVQTMAAKKMHLPFWTAFVRGVLCNWLVVLAAWSYYRLKSESGKLIMIFWCLLAFIASGFEHSVANMTLLTLANLLPHGPEISWAAVGSNLVPVTLGNIVSGAMFMGLAYWYVSPVWKE